MTERAAVLPGTVDLLILRAVSLGTEHGYGILLRIEQLSGGAITLEQGALYPALWRLERQKLLDSTWGASENNRRAKFYSITRKGRQRLEKDLEWWERLVQAMELALRSKAHS